MTGYLFNFLIYTTAMIGVIFVALFAFKTFSNKCFSRKTLMLNIEDTMNLSPKKTLYVIKADNERFLIASDSERTTLISKLGSIEKSLEKQEEPTLKAVREDKSSKLRSFDGVESLSEFASIVELKKNKQPMMKELAKKLSAI